ncbi:hypothetical protein BGY98DRAFT_940334 [Russula aff. rugulosa BPL654]|nr:hypothetical protein BGY98DRAFT_940334 [Russula aff. rugulosa BPL654]
MYFIALATVTSLRLMLVVMQPRGHATLFQWLTRSAASDLGLRARDQDLSGPKWKSRFFCHTSSHFDPQTKLSQRPTTIMNKGNESRSEKTRNILYDVLRWYEVVHARSSKSQDARYMAE